MTIATPLAIANSAHRADEIIEKSALKA